jgi:starch synthase
VRVTGGLDDSVTDLTEDERRANGIKFQEYSVRALGKAIRKATGLYESKPLLRAMQRNAMQLDYSWERTATAYIEGYERAMHG